MTNREELMQKMHNMDSKELAKYLSEVVSGEISNNICKQCLKANCGEWIMEVRNLKNCPRKISDWLQEESC